MTEIQVRNNLAAPHQGKDSQLYRIIASKTGTPGGRPFQSEMLDFSALWSSQWWGLESCSVFKRLAPDKRIDVLIRCNQSLLTEAYFIEKSGLAYSAKMVLTADNTDEAQLFALIGADEAKHLAWIEPYVPGHCKQLDPGHFLSFLSTLIEDYPPSLLVYLVQVILEGWGLDHYKRLAENCLHQDLSAVLAAICREEALHHRSGTILFNAPSLSPRDFSLIEAALRQYTLMVRVGPQSALSIVAEVAGGLDRVELEEVLVALRHCEETPRKLALLRKLMSQPHMEQVVQKLDSDRCFLPANLPEAVGCYLSSHQ